MYFIGKNDLKFACYSPLPDNFSSVFRMLMLYNPFLSLGTVMMIPCLAFILLRKRLKHQADLGISDDETHGSKKKDHLIHQVVVADAHHTEAGQY